MCFLLSLHNSNRWLEINDHVFYYNRVEVFTLEGPNNLVSNILAYIDTDAIDRLRCNSCLRYLQIPFVESQEDAIQVYLYHPISIEIFCYDYFN